MSAKDFEPYTVHELAANYGADEISTHRDNIASVVGILLRNHTHLDIDDGELVEYLVTLTEMESLMDVLMVENVELPDDDTDDDTDGADDLTEQ